MQTSKMKRTGWGALMAGLVAASALHAGQDPSCGSRMPAKRVAVEACLRASERALQSGTDGINRDDMRRTAERLRARLKEGDFHPGDRIYLRVAGESTLTDTLTVVPGPAILLPRIGSVSLAGVLRGDLRPYLSLTLGQFLKDPSVEARSLVRLSVVGEVTRPGFYAVPSETAMADVLMLAGGLTQRAKANAMRVERGTARIWEPAAVRGALSDGATVDDMLLQEGDQIVVPANGGTLDTILKVAAVMIPAVTAVVVVSR